MVASQRLVTVLLLTAVVTVPGVAHSASRRTCGFYPANLHRVSQQKNITCAEAKRVLLGLRGRRDTVPMICGKSRVIHGWRLESGSRLWSAVVNRYSRGRQSFVYLREQNAYRIYCPPEGGSTSEGVQEPPSAELPQATRSAAATRYQLVRRPIVLIEPSSSGSPGFQVRVRMNRRLPVDNQGVRANLLVGKASSDDSPAPFGRRSRHCYAGEIGSPEVDPTLKDAHPGTVVRVTIRVAGQRSIVRSVAVRSVRTQSSANALKALGCGSVDAVSAAVSMPAGHGTGVLSKTRFVKAPIIVLFAPSKPDPHDAGYTIYFRLSRDLPRNPAGGRNAVFAPFEDSADPILGLLARPGRWCFTQDVGTDPPETGLPTKRGSKIRLILKAHDHRHRTGTLPATATLRVQKPRAANDYRPYPYPKELGCPSE